MRLDAWLASFACLSVFVFFCFREIQAMITLPRAEVNKDFYGIGEENEWMREPNR